MNKVLCLIAALTMWILQFFFAVRTGLPDASDRFKQ